MVFYLKQCASGKNLPRFLTFFQMLSKNDTGEVTKYLVLGVCAGYWKFRFLVIVPLRRESMDSALSWRP